jgi:hypothetical protein
MRFLAQSRLQNSDPLPNPGTRHTAHEKGRRNIGEESEKGLFQQRPDLALVVRFGASLPPLELVELGADPLQLELRDGRSILCFSPRGLVSYRPGMFLGKALLRQSELVLVRSAINWLGGKGDRPGRCFG